MTYIAVIGVGLLVALVLIGGALMILGNIFSKSFEILTYILEKIFGIPSKVEMHVDPSLNYDKKWRTKDLNVTQLQTLRRYNPRVDNVPVLPASDVASNIKSRRSAQVKTVRLEDLEILASTPKEPYPSVADFYHFDKKCERIALTEIASPPSVDDVQQEIPEPKITLPNYPKIIGFCNSWVQSKYSEEIARFKAAQRRWDSICEAIENANEEIKNERVYANKRYEQALRDRTNAQESSNSLYDQWDADRQGKLSARLREVKAFIASLEAPGFEGLRNRIEFALGNPNFPNFVPLEHDIRFDPENGILICEHEFPDLRQCEFTKTVKLKSGPTQKPANKTERKAAESTLYPLLVLRIATEIASLDRDQIISAITVNGWAEYIDPTTGQEKRAFVSSLFASKEELLNINLARTDPQAALKALKGASTVDVGIVPITPQMKIERNDSRFVDSKDVLSGVQQDENIAAMDWEDFEHLCRELFERVFASEGADVRVTQASRDQGVDAIIFDPDPLKGGKIVVQAKRYVNLVDVSAVRDLFGTVHNEGAMKGILVSTSNYGPESYSFAKDKPITLINGAELLGLLENHGYSFRIDLEEARRMLRAK